MERDVLTRILEHIRQTPVATPETLALLDQAADEIVGLRRVVLAFQRGRSPTDGRPQHEVFAERLRDAMEQNRRNKAALDAELPATRSWTIRG